ncbi:MAG: hypothetical protein IT429_17355 [Gemmataceae bacterium]|nr:hypothetical protein [Gemmataceae bacterium]
MDALRGTANTIDDALATGSPLRAKVAFAVAAKMLDVQRDAGAAIVALLDPNVGSTFDRRA